MAQAPHPDSQALLMPFIRRKDWKGAFQLIRDKLGAAQPSPFDGEGGAKPLPMTDEVILWVETYLLNQRKAWVPAAFYFEVDFDPASPSGACIEICGVAYKEDEGDDDSSFDWLSHHTTNMRMHPFPQVQGFEPFMQHMVSGGTEAVFSPAWIWGQWVITLRFLELMENVYNKAWDKKRPWAKASFHLSALNTDWTLRWT
jgi:hypothetical protein